MSKFRQDKSRNSMIVNLTKNIFFSTGLQTWIQLRLVWNSSCCSKETPSKNGIYGNILPLSCLWCFNFIYFLLISLLSWGTLWSHFYCQYRSWNTGWILYVLCFLAFSLSDFWEWILSKTEISEIYIFLWGHIKQTIYSLFQEHASRLSWI